MHNMQTSSIIAPVHDFVTGAFRPLLFTSKKVKSTRVEQRVRDVAWREKMTAFVCLVEGRAKMYTAYAHVPAPHTAHTVYLSAVHICLSDSCTLCQEHDITSVIRTPTSWQSPDHGATRPLEGVHRRRQRAMTPLPTGSIVQRWLVGCGILVVLSLPACTRAQSVPTGYTRFAQHWIVG